jgi:hypothetical protein
MPRPRRSRLRSGRRSRKAEAPLSSAARSVTSMARHTRARSSTGQSIRLRIWRLGVRILSGAPVSKTSYISCPHRRFPARADCGIHGEWPTHTPPPGQPSYLRTTATVSRTMTRRKIDSRWSISRDRGASCGGRCHNRANVPTAGVLPADLKGLRRLLKEHAPDDARQQLAIGPWSTWNCRVSRSTKASRL